MMASLFSSTLGLINQRRAQRALPPLLPSTCARCGRPLTATSSVRHDLTCDRFMGARCRCAGRVCDRAGCAQVPVKWQQIAVDGQVIDAGTFWACGYCRWQDTCTQTAAGRQPISEVAVVLGLAPSGEAA